MCAVSRDECTFFPYDTLLVLDWYDTENCFPQECRRFNERIDQHAISLQADVESLRTKHETAAQAASSHATIISGIWLSIAVHVEGCTVFTPVGGALLSASTYLLSFCRRAGYRNNVCQVHLRIPSGCIPQHGNPIAHHGGGAELSMMSRSAGKIFTVVPPHFGQRKKEYSILRYPRHHTHDCDLSVSCTVS